MYSAETIYLEPKKRGCKRKGSQSQWDIHKKKTRHLNLMTDTNIQFQLNIVEGESIDVFYLQIKSEYEVVSAYNLNMQQVEALSRKESEEKLVDWFHYNLSMV